jgi:hypothetical protein
MIVLLSPQDDIRVRDECPWTWMRTPWTCPVAMNLRTKERGAARARVERVVLGAAAGLALANAGRATIRAEFPDPPSDALRSSAGFALEGAGRATKRLGFPDPPSCAPVPTSQAVPGTKQTTEESASPPSHRFPERSKRRKYRQVRHSTRFPERSERRKNRQTRHGRAHRSDHVFG